MGSRIQCFLIEPTDRTERKLRRFAWSNGPDGKCAGAALQRGGGRYGYHNAMTAFPEGRCTYDKVEEVWRWGDEHEIPLHADTRWPTKCDGCDYVFKAEDQWQLFREVIYRRKDGTGGDMTLRDCPPGAMYDAFWYPEKGPDGIALCVSLPPEGGLDYWHVDGPSKTGGGWTRSGTLPNVTANPSILTPRYHGFLRSGFLEEV